MEEPHRIKSELFDLLSLGFLYPSGGTAEATGNGYLNALQARISELEKGFDGAQDMRAESDTAGESYPEAPRAESMLEREKEYTRLFVNAYPRVVAPPYGSVYMDGKGLVWGESTSKVLNLYMAAGLEMVEGYHDVPDHIAAELAFASYLQSRMEPGDEICAACYVELIDEHLSRWALPFLKKVEENTRSPFYRTLARLTREVIRVEAMALTTGRMS